MPPTPKPQPTAYVALPCGGPASVGAVLAWRAPNRLHGVHPDHQIRAGFFGRSESSDSNSNFNRMLAEAYGLRDAGRVTHFAMIHADVVPREPGWLSTLYEVMERTGATVVSANVPIKAHDRDGKTSTAIADRDDPWRPVRYVMESDRALLGDTFGPNDVCGPDEVLCVNNGLILMDLRWHGWTGLDEPFGFDRVNRIDRQPDGSYVSRFEPEDWRLGKFLQRHGAKVRATWAVALDHHGQDVWPSHTTTKGSD